MVRNQCPEVGRISGRIIIILQLLKLNIVNVIIKYSFLAIRVNATAVHCG